MKKKALVFCVIFAVCFLVLGAIFRSGANGQKGSKMMSGYSINGQVTLTDSGTIGGNSEKEENLSTLSTFFFIVGGISLVASIALGADFVIRKNH